MSRASILGAGDWALVFVTTPTALAVVVFPWVWGDALAAMLAESSSALPVLTVWLLDGVMTTLWGLFSLAAVGVACALGGATLGTRRALLVGALIWACLGFGVIWLAAYLPIFGTVGSVGY